MPTHLDPLPPYARAARFATSDAARRAYRAIQTMIRDDEGLDLSVYNLLLGQVPHVVVIGEEPGAVRNERLTAALADGEPTVLPPELVRQLAARRADQDQGFSHRHPGLPGEPLA